MAIVSRADLKASFTKGKRPKEGEFWDWQESYYHKNEDPIKVTGWLFRSFFKDLRAEGATTIAKGGLTMLEVPLSVTKLKKIRVVGRAVPVPLPGPFTITVSLSFYSDIQIANLNGTPSNGSVFPTTLFFHPVISSLAAPPVTFKITTAGPQFDSTFDFASIPKEIPLAFTQFRALQLTISIGSGEFKDSATGDSPYLYYGLEYD